MVEVGGGRESQSVGRSHALSSSLLLSCPLALSLDCVTASALFFLPALRNSRTSSEG